MKKSTNKIRVGFALSGSFCTFDNAVKEIEALILNNADVTPIMSFMAAKTDTRFGTADSFIQKIEGITGKKIIRTIEDAEPIGPKKLFDILIIEPCTGNTLGKLAAGITDTPVLMAAKAHLRNGRPLLIAVSTNDGLSGSAKNIGLLMGQKNIFFVPHRQDDHILKPTSIVADFDKTLLAMHAALEERQIQPVLL